MCRHEVAVGSEDTARTFRLCSLGLCRIPSYLLTWPWARPLFIALKKESVDGKEHLIRSSPWVWLWSSVGRTQKCGVCWDERLGETKAGFWSGAVWGPAQRSGRGYVRRAWWTPEGCFSKSVSPTKGPESLDSFLPSWLLAQTGLEGGLSLLWTWASQLLSVPSTRGESWVHCDSSPWGLWNTRSTCRQPDVP